MDFSKYVETLYEANEELKDVLAYRDTLPEDYARKFISLFNRLVKIENKTKDEAFELAKEKIEGLHSKDKSEHKGEEKGFNYTSNISFKTKLKTTDITFRAKSDKWPLRDKEKRDIHFWLKDNINLSNKVDNDILTSPKLNDPNEDILTSFSNDMKEHIELIIKKELEKLNKELKELGFGISKDGE